MKKNLYLTILQRSALTVLAAVLLGGCVREEVRGPKTAFGSKEKKSYKPVTGHRLKLELVGNGQLFAGGGGTINFVLINEGDKKVVIEEWFANESDNLVISCQNWLPGMTGADPGAWVKLDFTPRRPPWRYPLHLDPGNRVFITKQLPFVDKLSISPGSERRYFIKGELTLTSLRLQSRIGVISVRNPMDKRAKKIQSRESRHFGR